MEFIATELNDAYIVDFKRFEDARGFFATTWSQQACEAHGLVAHVAQVNLSYNHIKGTLRGMHFRHTPYAETKLVRCTHGAIYDVIIDLRPESPSYKRWLGVELTAESRHALYVPEGFAHGFQTLEDACEVVYQVSQPYTPSAESGVRYNDSAFEITWPLPVTVMSEKDKQWSDFTD